MARYGMIIDETKCVGCYACRVACQNQNHLRENEAYNFLEEREFGQFPNFNREFLPVQCQHCDNPPCVSVCPTGASHKRKDGVVLVNEKDCIGCKYCIAACPYQCPHHQEGRVHREVPLLHRICGRGRETRLHDHLHDRCSPVRGPGRSQERNFAVRRQESGIA